MSTPSGTPVRLLAISIGPVQEFIAAARKTGDLLAGSNLLVELTGSAAVAAAQYGNLIFPANAYEPGPNKILLELMPQVEPAVAASAARQAAVSRLQQLWSDHCGRLRGAANIALAEVQIGTFIEFYAASAEAATYTEARTQTERALAGCKALRAFDTVLSEPGRVRSQLDPSRDSIIPPNLPELELQRLNVARAEPLDAVSLLKRQLGRKGNDGESWPSTTDIALASAPSNIDPEIMRELNRIGALCQPEISGVDLIYPGPAETAIQQLSPDPDIVARLKTVQNSARNSIGVTVDTGLPTYYAILTADGDSMGELLSKATTAGEHRKVSTALSQFSNKARELAKASRGTCVYAGGDDVLALLPVRTALCFAEQLHAEYIAALLSVANGTSPGLSIGLAIVHHSESLQHSIQHARVAEHHSKKMPQKDALTVALHTRGGAPVSVTYTWRNAPEGKKPTEIFKTLVGAFHPSGGGLSTGLPYELAAMARDFTGMNDSATTNPSDPLDAAVQIEALRVFDRKCNKDNQKHSGSEIDAARLLLSDFTAHRNGEGCAPESLRKIADAMIIARFLAAGYAGTEATV